MGSVRVLLKGLAVIGLVVLVTSSALAQAAYPPMSAERSRAIQGELQRIDQDRAGAVNQLLSQWTPWVDNTAYDLWGELEPIAMRAPAWQIYGASLVGDFTTMVRILTGQEGAGYYINTLTEPQAKVPMGPTGIDALGDTTASLVYTPITPCRVVDTRNTPGARTGIIAANASRAFDLPTTAFSSGQGVTGPCTGLPSFSYAAWAVTITAIGYSGNGWLTVWPATEAEPFTSVINYGSAPYAIASGVTLTGCYSCADDIMVKAGNAATHVVIDVLGYYSPATVSSAAITRIAGTGTSISAGGRTFVTSGACPAGTVMVGGENDFSGSDVAIGESRQATTTTWTMWMINNDAVARTATVYARCMDTPAQDF